MRSHAVCDGFAQCQRRSGVKKPPLIRHFPGYSMSTYAIGDVQGCFAPLQRLLDRLNFDPAKDQLWFAGDLVNRGPNSLAVMRLVHALGPAAVAVLGNHDLHLLARAAGGRAGRLDSLDELVAAPDCGALLHWLRHRPLLHEANGWAMAHAGIAPTWTLPEARAAARDVETALRGKRHVQFLQTMYGNTPTRWAEGKSRKERLRYSVNAYTRMRYCDADGGLEFQAKGTPGSQPAGLLPWFALPQRVAIDAEIIFGHWSTLGQVHWPQHRVWGLDTGAVWGGKLTALCLETRQLTAVDCPEYQQPDGAGD